MCLRTGRPARTSLWSRYFQIISERRRDGELNLRICVIKHSGHQLRMGLISLRSAGARGQRLRSHPAETRVRHDNAALSEIRRIGRYGVAQLAFHNYLRGANEITRHV